MFQLKRGSSKTALLLILALVMTLFAGIGGAGAASTNTLDRVPVVAEDYAFTAADAPRLRIEENNPGEFGTQGFSFRLNLVNAEWQQEMFTQVEQLYNSLATVNEVTFSQRTNTSLTVQLQLEYDPVQVEQKRYFNLPLITELQGEGEARVTIDPLGSAVSASTLAFARGAAGGTTASTGPAKTLTRGDNQEGARIIIDETAAGALRPGIQEFRLRLPLNFEWHPNTTVTLDTNLQGTIPELTITNNSRDLIVKFEITAPSVARGSIIIGPRINVTRQAAFGEVNVSLTAIQGDVTSVASIGQSTYRDFGVDVSVAEVKDFMAGHYDTNALTAEIKIEERVANSLSKGSNLEFDFPDWVKLAGDIMIKNDRAATRSIAVDITELDQSSFTYQLPGILEVGVNNPQTITMEISLTVAADAVEGLSRDIVLYVDGAGLDGIELPVGRALAPITVTIDPATPPAFSVGVLEQASPDILIRENYPGAIRDLAAASTITGEPRNQVKIFVRDAFQNSIRFDDFDWEVVAGDLEIRDARIEGDFDQEIMLEIGADSQTASQIRLSNITMTLDRTVPQGMFRLDVGGGALVDNYTEGNDLVNYVARFDYVEVRTPTLPAGITAVFTIGSTTYIANGETRDMDVAPYIKDDRTFIPVRFVAQAFGLQEDQIIWEPNAKKVTVLAGNRVVEMTIGSRDLFINTVRVPMDTAPEIVDGRTMLPIRWVGEALGVTFEWDPEERTVTART